MAQVSQPSSVSEVFVVDELNIPVSSDCQKTIFEEGELRYYKARTYPSLSSVVNPSFPKLNLVEFPTR